MSSRRPPLSPRVLADLTRRVSEDDSPRMRQLSHGISAVIGWFWFLTILALPVIVVLSLLNHTLISGWISWAVGLYIVTWFLLGSVILLTSLIQRDSAGKRDARLGFIGGAILLGTVCVSVVFLSETQVAVPAWASIGSAIILSLGLGGLCLWWPSRRETVSPMLRLINAAAIICLCGAVVIHSILAQRVALGLTEPVQHFLETIRTMTLIIGIVWTLVTYVRTPAASSRR